MSYDVSFNPRARDGREGVLQIHASSYQVSIHAPVMDAKNADPSSISLAWFQSTRP